jgi:hypothetical protein
MGITPNNRMLELMDKKDRPRGRAGMTAAEATDQYALRTEREMHSKFCSYCGLHGILFEHEAPTKRSTSRPGWPDFRCFYMKQRVLFIEFKVQPNVLTTEQELVRVGLEMCGFRYIVAYSLSEAIHAAQQYLLK